MTIKDLTNIIAQTQNVHIEFIKEGEWITDWSGEWCELPKSYSDAEVVELDVDPFLYSKYLRIEIVPDEWM